jgi:small subunit ribosomal protein S15
MPLTKEKKATVLATYGGSEKNTGSIEGQIALLSLKINHISGHLKDQRKDFSSTRSLIKLVGQRKKLLKYLMHRDIAKYRSLIEKLKLRK